MSETVIQTRKLTKEFVRDEFHVVALDEVDIARWNTTAAAISLGPRQALPAVGSVCRP